MSISIALGQLGKTAYRYVVPQDMKDGVAAAADAINTDKDTQDTKLIVPASGSDSNTIRQPAP